MDALKRVDNLLRHIKHVQDNCVLLGTKLIELGEVDIGILLIANGQIHDNSKWYGIEWENLTVKAKDKTDPLLCEAIKHHNTKNKHHPEYWGSIHKMPLVYVAEMVCDWKARSSEFGSCLREYIEHSATKRFEFEMSDPIGREIENFVNLLLDEPF